MVGYTIPDEVTVATISALIVVVIALGVGLARVREKVTRLEEWVRLYERQEGLPPPD